MVGIVPTASVRPIAPRLGLVPVPRTSASAPTRSWTDGALLPPCRLGGGRPCTVGALLGGGRSPWRLVPWDCDAKLSAFCTTACSRRPRSPWRTLLPSGVNGSGIALRRSTAAITFWLAVLKTGGLSPPSSSMMRRLTSRARRLSSPPSPRPDWSWARVSGVDGGVCALLRAWPPAH